MSTVQHSILVTATAQDVMAALVDASSWPDWYSGITKPQTDDAFPQKGGQVTFKILTMGLSLPLTETVVEYEPDSLHVMEMSGAMSGIARWQVTAEGDATRLTTTFDYQLSGGIVGKIADALFVRRMNSKALQSGLSNLKTMLEADS